MSQKSKLEERNASAERNITKSKKKRFGRLMKPWGWG